MVYSTNCVTRPPDPDDPDTKLITSANQEIGSLLSTELGEQPIPFPYSFQVKNGDDGNDTFLQALKAKIEFRDTDTKEKSVLKTKLLDSHNDFAHFLAQARGSLYEVDTQLEIAVMRKFIGNVAELGTEQLVGADVLIGPQRRNNVHRVVLSFRRDRDIPPYRCDRLSPTLRQYQFITASEVPADLMNTISKLIGSLSRRLRATTTPAQGTKHKAQGTT